MKNYYVNQHWKVCIQCMTYNQSRYITETLDGFTIQKTSFPFLIMIVDDASTDGEQNIIDNYLSDYFNLSNDCSYKEETGCAFITFAQHISNRNCFVVAIKLKYNHYSIRKDKLEYLKCWRDNSDYEAICEGDDYWIDPLKLQNQVSYLDENPEYAYVYARCKVFSQDGEKFTGKTLGFDCVDFRHLLLSNGVCTLTTCYRLEACYRYESEMLSIVNDNKWMMGDYSIWLFFEKNYKGYFWDKVVGVYRELSSSASHFLDYKKQIQFMDNSRDISLFYATAYGMPNSYIRIIKGAYFSSYLLKLKRDGKWLCFFKRCTFSNLYNALIYVLNKRYN